MRIQPVETSRVFVDFQNADAQGRLRLNCVGTIKDISAQKVELRAGQRLTLDGDDLEVDGIVDYSESERLWVAVINWDAVEKIES